MLTGVSITDDASVIPVMTPITKRQQYINNLFLAMILPL
jgi:hypothetical protein